MKQQKLEYMTKGFLLAGIDIMLVLNGYNNLGILFGIAAFIYFLKARKL